MMKTYRHFCYALIAAAACAGFTSCSNDDNDDDRSPSPLWVGELGAPSHEDDAVAYNILNNSQYGLIELTASGNYIVTPPESATISYAATEAMPARHLFAAAPAPASRNFGNEILFGTYTQLPDGSYKLQGFGTIGAFDNGTLDLTLDNGTFLQLDAVKITNVESTPLNNRLCRTWYVTSATRTFYDINGNFIGRENVSADEIEEEFVQYVIVTKAGTFVQVEWDNSIEGRGQWNWTDKTNQVFAYQFTDYYDSGSVQVAFENDRAYFLQTFHDYDDFGREIICIEQVNTVAR